MYPTDKDERKQYRDERFTYANNLAGYLLSKKALDYMLEPEKMNGSRWFDTVRTLNRFYAQLLEADFKKKNCDSFVLYDRQQKEKEKLELQEHQEMLLKQDTLRRVSDGGVSTATGLALLTAAGLTQADLADYEEEQNYYSNHYPSHNIDGSPTINIDGSPMMGGVDIYGNPYGVIHDYNNNFGQDDFTGNNFGNHDN
jgi:hypothetical protein